MTKATPTQAFLLAARALLRDIPNEERNAALQALVVGGFNKSAWSNMPPQIIDTAKADIGVGLALYMPTTDNDAMCVLMRAAGTQQYQIVGGFMNLAAKGDASPQAAALREMGEELIYTNGRPILKPKKYEPTILKAQPLDTLKIEVRGQPRLVQSFALSLYDHEINKIMRQMLKLEQDSSQGSKMLKATKGEIDGIGIYRLSSILQKPEVLRHPDQLSLFKRLKAQLA